MNKVLILTEFFPPNNSGVSQSVKRLFDLLQHHHHSNISVAVIEPLTDAYYYPQFWDERINNITIWHINVGKNRPLSTPEDIRVSEYMLKEIVLTNSIDIIHAYNIFKAKDGILILFDPTNPVALDYGGKVGYAPAFSIIGKANISDVEEIVFDFEYISKIHNLPIHESEKDRKYRTCNYELNNQNKSDKKCK